MTVQPAMTPVAHAARTHEPAGQTLRWMAHWELPHLPVVNADGIAVGVLSLADHEGRFGGIPRELDVKSVDELMERPPTVGPRTGLMRALRLLRNNRVHALSVVDSNGRPVGVLEAANLRTRRTDAPALTAIATHQGA
ncbi:MAG: CBS domain-containing protein [Bradymonadia bacterium]|jgi:CBS domain-containing protein